MTKYRIESDSIGSREVPIDAYYGVQTLRAYENFKISGKVVNVEFIKAIVEIKQAAAITNGQVEVIDKNIASAIVKACDEILDGNFIDNFIVDAIQGGAGTSLNMNANEVIANRALEILGYEKGDYQHVHPNDHVNCGQSTNDVFPSAGKIATIRLLDKTLKALNVFLDELNAKAEQFADVIKMGRTEMQDAVPISFGQVFNAYANAIKRDVERFKLAKKELSVLNMGGTAIGTGINAENNYIKKIVSNVVTVTGLELSQADDLVDSTQNLDCFVYVSGIIKSLATTLSKIANDLRLMSSGPRAGFGEICLPPKQNGSSIMPGKINPVIPEVVNQIAFKTIGNDTTITLAVESGQLELNAFEPIIFYCLFESLDVLTNGLYAFTNDCIRGITINERNCKEELERSVGTVTALCPYIGYKKASKIAKKALKENRKIREVVMEEVSMTADEVDRILDPKKMI